MLENIDTNQKFAESEEIRNNMKYCFNLVDEYEKLIKNDKSNSNNTKIEYAIIQMRQILNLLKEEVENTLNSKVIDLNKYNFLALDVAKRKTELFMLVESHKRNNSFLY